MDTGWSQMSPDMGSPVLSHQLHQPWTHDMSCTGEGEGQALPAPDPVLSSSSPSLPYLPSIPWTWIPPPLPPSMQKCRTFIEQHMSLQLGRHEPLKCQGRHQSQR